MLKGRDIVLLAKLSIDGRPWTIQALADELGLPPAGVQRSLVRLEQTGVYFPRRKTVALTLARELIVVAVKFLFPPRFLGEGVGVPTAWSAEPLRGKLISSSAAIDYVWADSSGTMSGIVLEPLDPRVPEIVSSDPRLGEVLALVDALRIGGARDREVAAELISERMLIDQRSAA